MTRSEHDTWDAASSVGATATGAAAVRAVISRQPDPLIIDPFAADLVERAGIEAFAALAARRIEPAAVFGEMASPIVEGTSIRTKVHDEYLLDRTAQGVRQVVVLASGLDTRAYRLPWPAGTTVFDLDQLSMIAFKTTTLVGIDAMASCDHRPVGADLRYDWPGALTAAGFDSTQSTVWFVEGLLPYLPPPAQDALLDHITDLSAHGSSLIVESVTDARKAEHHKFRAGVDEMSQLQNLDVGNLMYDGHRHETGEYLQNLGWTTTMVSIAEMYEEAGRAEPPDPRPFPGVMTVRATFP
jgi:methyltransferase (TIGR00027 family)